MSNSRIAYQVLALGAQELPVNDQWTPTRRYVTEAWRQEWRVPGLDPVTAMSRPRCWMDDEDDGEHGFGATLDDALADLLRREHDAERARYQPPACKLRVDS